MGLIAERYADKIAGVWGCLDRPIVTGTLPTLCYGEGRTQYLSAQGLRIFDFVSCVKPLTEASKANAEGLAAAAGLKVDYVGKKNFRKEDKIEAVLKERGNQPGPVWIFSALEPCTTYRPWHDKGSGRTQRRFDDGKCLPYYFYFIEEELGRCYVRVPTWCPFRLQFYCNGHNWLARQLERRKIACQMLDNVFVEIGDWVEAQPLAEDWKPERLPRRLEEWARRYCPIFPRIEASSRWSLDTAAYAAGLVFDRQADLQGLQGEPIRTAVHTVKPDNIATFLGQKLHGNYPDERGNRYNVRIEGTRVRHSRGRSSIEMYDKFGRILRMETTTWDVTFFPHYRPVEQREGTAALKYAPMKKTIYRLGALREVRAAAHRRYWEFVSAIDDPRNGIRKWGKLSHTVHETDRSYRGFHLFDEPDELPFQVIARGEFNSSGFQNKRLRAWLPQLNGGQVSRLLQRLRAHGPIKKANRCYQYYLTTLGRRRLHSV